MENSLDLWVKEISHQTAGTIFKVEKTLFSDRSPYQQIDVVQSAGHGRLLLNDGIFMLSEYDEFIYHEMIAHIPLFVHPDPKKVLVIGGGDGGTVREVLRHKGVERAVMVEIDAMVVEASRAHLPGLSCALDDPRLELRIEDGIKYVASTSEQFDVVLIDSTDPIGPSKPLFNEDFYRNVSRILTPDGIMVTQAESPFFEAPMQKVLFKNQRPHFKRLHMYLYTTLTYPGGLWSFGFASNRLCPLNDYDETRYAESGIKTRYYNPGIHRGAFMLPNFIYDSLAGVLDRIDWRRRS